MGVRAVLLLVLAGAAVLVSGAPAMVGAQDAGGGRSRYIVVLAAGTAPGEFARATRVSPAMTYGRVFPGLAADLTPDEVRRLRADASVRGIAPARTIRATQVLAAPAALIDPGLPTGVDRVDAEFAPVDETAAIAVLDSGIDLKAKVVAF